MSEKEAEDVKNGENSVSQEDDDKELRRRVEDLEIQRKLMMKLAAAGARDIETAVLVGMSRLAENADANLDSVVEGIKKEKGHLFAESEERRGNELPRRTGGAKQKKQDGQSVVERAAKKAAKSGSRVDLQEYLRLRRLDR
jgi:hypothetical protein